MRAGLDRSLFSFVEGPSQGYKILVGQEHAQEILRVLFKRYGILRSRIYPSFKGAAEEVALLDLLGESLPHF